MFKLEDLRVHDFLFDHTEGEFVPDVIQYITKSTLNHVKRVSKILAPTPDGIYIAEAIASGYKERTLRESTGKHDKETRVCRYHGDGVGLPYTPEQIRLMTAWDTYYLKKGIGYGYSQLIMLAILKQVENDSLLGYYLGERMEEVQRQIEFFLPQFTCSEAAYRKDVESGVSIRILKDSKHLQHYSGGDVLERYRALGKDELDPVIADWLSPHDLYESPDIITMDSLDYRWR